MVHRIQIPTRNNLNTGNRKSVHKPSKSHPRQKKSTFQKGINAEIINDARNSSTIVRPARDRKARENTTNHQNHAEQKRAGGKGK